MEKNLNPKSSLADFIILHNDFLPHDLCDQIVSEYAPDEYLYDVHDAMDTSFRNLFELNMSDPEVINSSNSYVRKNLDRQVWTKVRDEECGISAFHPIQTIKDTGYSLRRMVKGHFYKQHKDKGPYATHSISVSICLSDDYEGGELCFFDRELSFKLKKGQALSFPSNYLYPHEVREVTAGTRYALITWLS